MPEELKADIDKRPIILLLPSEDEAEYDEHLQLPPGMSAEDGEAKVKAALRKAVEEFSEEWNFGDVLKLLKEDGIVKANVHTASLQWESYASGEES